MACSCTEPTQRKICLGFERRLYQYRERFALLDEFFPQTIRDGQRERLLHRFKDFLDHTGWPSPPRHAALCERRSGLESSGRR